jgi:hypothetical protein
MIVCSFVTKRALTETLKLAQEMNNFACALIGDVRRSL